MRINDPNLNGAAGLGKANLDRTAPASSRLKGPAGSADPVEDSVELSGLGTRIRELSGSTPERVAKIERLAELVATGKYQPDSAATSRAMVDEALANSSGK